MGKFSWFKAIVMSVVLSGILSAGILGILWGVQGAFDSSVDNRVSVDGRVSSVVPVDTNGETQWYGLEYSYEVNGERYLAVNEDDLYIDIPAFTENERATIWYDPENPSDAVFSELPPE